MITSKSKGKGSRNIFAAETSHQSNNLYLAMQECQSKRENTCNSLVTIRTPNLCQLKSIDGNCWLLGIALKPLGYLGWNPNSIRINLTAQLFIAQHFPSPEAKDFYRNITKEDKDAKR
jgi:hypothetical protein